MATKTPRKPEAELQPMLTFRLGGGLFALPIDEVIEAAAMVELAKMPGAPPQILGAANRHGAVLPMIDLRRVFQQGDSVVNTFTLFIVAQVGGRQVGLVVDEIQQVEYLNFSQIGHASASYIRGMITHKQQLIQIVALDRILSEILPDGVTQKQQL